MRKEDDLYEDDLYEDELDRMRARRQRQKRNSSSRSMRQEQDEDFEYIDDIEYADGIEAAGSFHAAASGRSRASRSADRSAQHTGRAAAGGFGSSRPARAHKKRRKKGGLVKLLVVLVLCLSAVFLYRRLTSERGYWTIAVFGVDSRDGNLGKGALSDVEMICSINRKTGEIRLASVFRDSYLRIDNDGSFDKINEAYFLGGHEQAVAALEANLGLKVDDYATFNWTAVINAINVLGGVDLEITDKEFAYINSFITETVESTGIGSYQLEHSGMNHLDGVQAVAYARLRLMDTDFARTERQRKVMGLAMEKAKQADFSTLSSLVGAVFPEISTSIGVDDLFGVAKNAKKYYIGQTSGFPFSHTEMKIGKKACVIPTTLESNVIQLHQFLYDDDQYTPSDTVRSISAEIAQRSGLSDPGKDTESGKNVGASGNTGGGEAAQPAQSQAASPAPAEETTPESEAGETSGQETEESMTSDETAESSETSDEPATIVPSPGADSSDHNSDNSTVGQETEDAKHPVEAEHGTSGSNTNGPGTDGPGNSGNSGNSSGNPGGSGNSLTVPGSAAPSPGSGTGSANASLEAPGQNSVPAPAEGPGA